jgi:hypothetical protein
MTWAEINKATNSPSVASNLSQEKNQEICHIGAPKGMEPAETVHVWTF